MVSRNVLITATALVVALCGVASATTEEPVSFASVSSHSHIGSGRFHLAEHDAIASRVLRANAEAEVSAGAETETEAGAGMFSASTLALDRFLQDPNIPESDKLVRTEPLWWCETVGLNVCRCVVVWCGGGAGMMG